MLLTCCRVLLTTQTQKLSSFSNLSGHCLRFLLFLHCSLHLQPHTHTSHSRPAVFRPPGSEPPKKLQIKMWFPDHIPDPLIGTLDGRVRNLYVHSTPPTPPSYLRTIAQPENNTCGFRKILPFHLWFLYHNSHCLTQSSKPTFQHPSWTRKRHLLLTRPVERNVFLNFHMLRIISTT